MGEITHWQSHWHTCTQSQRENLRSQFTRWYFVLVSFLVWQEVGAALLDSMGRFRDNYFGRGGGHRDFWRGGSFSEIGGCLERKLRLLHFYIFMLSLEALLLRNALAGLRDMNFDAQISLQAQHSVDF